MPSARERRGKKEKKIGNLEDLLKAEGKQISDNVQGDTSQSLNAKVQQTNCQVTEMLN